jgi:phospholipid/cholesterol/gamma-HCH transport system ATP-binding protein
VVDLVTVGVLRELGVLLTAIIVAGRSGSAFAAEIGAMQLNEEVDALHAIGVDPIEVLVLPRVLGLLIALPLLTVIADLIGLVGGGLLCHVLLHMPLAQYLNRVQERDRPTTFWVGLIKAPVFAVLIAISGCWCGMRVRGSSRDLGRLTTPRWCSRHLHACCWPTRCSRCCSWSSTSDGHAVQKCGASSTASGAAGARRTDMQVRGRDLRHRRRLGRRQVGAAADHPRPAPADAGRSCFEGRDMTRHERRRAASVKASYGVTFQEGALFSSLTVLQNVQLPMLEHLQLIHAALDELALLKVELVGLPADAARKYPAQLSGGMIKRAALARALALDPLLLFLDEPTAGLDPISAAAFDELLVYLQRELKLTVVMITHDLDTIFRTCNHVGCHRRRPHDQRYAGGHRQNRHPWIQAYFHGERARSAGGEHGT